MPIEATAPIDLVSFAPLLRGEVKFTDGRLALLPS
jgi:hypothetical protein